MVFIFSVVYMVFLYFILINIKYKKLKVIFFISGVVTLIICMLGLGVSLPFTGSDAATFEMFAWRWSQGSLADVLSTFNISKSYLISSITAFFYYFAGREPIIPIIINGVLGLFIMYYSVKLFDEVWGKYEKRKVLFFIMVAFSPMLTINSAVILRENYIILFLLIATFHLARFANNGNPLSAFLFIIFTLFSSFFHGGTILYAMGLPLYLIFSQGKMSYSAKAIWMVLFFIILSIVLNYISFGKIQNLQDSGLSTDYLIEKLSSDKNANTTYLQSMIPNNAFDILWQTPIRAFFFLTKPFIWDVRSFGHAISFLDALIWGFIVFTIYKNRLIIYRNPAAVAVLLSCIVAIFAFSYGTTNFGTAIRHRTKFYVEMLVLAAPFFLGFKFKGSKR